MTDEVRKKRKGVTGFMAKVLNAAGSAVVDVYDLGSNAVGCVFSSSKESESKKTKSDIPGKTKKIIKKGVNYIYPDKEKIIQDRIKIKEDKLNKLYSEIGKEEVKQAESGEKESESLVNVKSLISEIREYEEQIARLKDKAENIEQEKQEKKEKKLKERKKVTETKRSPKPVADGLPAHQAIEDAIAASLSSSRFESASEKAKFEKVARDLLSEDPEIRILATNELAKMKNEAAIPVLTESVRIEDPNLTSEIINALISMGSVKAVPLFREKVTDGNYRIRMACLRGIYKLAEDDDEALQLLINAVKDEHPDVRKTAITFIGWKDNAEAVPALVQSLRDDHKEVVKAALSALSTIRDKSTVLPVIRVLGDEDADLRQQALDAVKMITGEQIAFDLQASGDELASAVDGLIEWWQKLRTGAAQVVDEPVDDIEESADESDASIDENIQTDPSWTKSDLTKLTKAKLLALCDENELNCNDGMTKIEIINAMLDSQKSADDA